MRYPKLTRAREWLLPTPRFDGPDTIDTEDDIPIVTEDYEVELLTEAN